MKGKDSYASPESRTYRFRVRTSESDENLGSPVKSFKLDKTPNPTETQLCGCESEEKKINDELLLYCKKLLAGQVKINHNLLHRKAKAIFESLDRSGCRYNHKHVHKRFIVSNGWVKKFIKQHQTLLKCDEEESSQSTPCSSSNPGHNGSKSKPIKVMTLRFLSESQVQALTKSISKSQASRDSKQSSNKKVSQVKVGDLPKNHIAGSYIYIYSENCTHIFAIKHVPPETESYSELPQKTPEGYEIIYLALEM